MLDFYKQLGAVASKIEAAGEINNQQVLQWVNAAIRRTLGPLGPDNVPVGLSEVPGKSLLEALLSQMRRPGYFKVNRGQVVAQLRAVIDQPIAEIPDDLSVQPDEEAVRLAARWTDAAIEDYAARCRRNQWRRVKSAELVSGLNDLRIKLGGLLPVELYPFWDWLKHGDTNVNVRDVLDRLMEIKHALQPTILALSGAPAA